MMPYIVKLSFYIFEMQDRRDDAILGLGSTARIFGDDTKLWLSGFSASMMGFLTTAGYLGEFSWPYYIGLGGVGAHLAWQVMLWTSVILSLY